MTQRISDAQATKDFIRIAENYCNIVNHGDKYTEIEMLQDSYSCLPQLCFYAMKLPDIQRSREYRRKSSLSTLDSIYSSLQLKFKNSHDSYLDIDPYEKKAKPLLASLSDDLADIFTNIAPGLEDWVKSDAAVRRGIIWEWKFLYENHWGDHAIRAFRAIHYLLFSQITDNFDDFVGLRKIS